MGTTIKTKPCSQYPGFFGRRPWSHKVFSTIDLVTAYHQIPVHLDDILSIWTFRICPYALWSSTNLPNVYKPGVMWTIVPIVPGCAKILDPLNSLLTSSTDQLTWDERYSFTGSGKSNALTSLANDASDSAIGAVFQCSMAANLIFLQEIVTLRNISTSYRGQMPIKVNAMQGYTVCASVNTHHFCGSEHKSVAFLHSEVQLR